MKQGNNLQRTKIYTFFGFCIVVLVEVFENSQSNYAMEREIGMVQIIYSLQKLLQYRWWANGIWVKYFPRIQYDAAQSRSQKFNCWDWVKHQRISQEGFFQLDVQRHLLWIKRQRKKNASQTLDSFTDMAKRCGTGQWSFLGLGSKKKWYSISADSPQWRVGQYGGKDDVGIRS